MAIPSADDLAEVAARKTTTGGYGAQAEHLYEQYVAQPATKGTAWVLAGMDPRAHPPGEVSQGAQELAGAIVPGTLGQLGRDVATWAMPGGPVARIAATTAASGAIDYLTDKGFLKGLGRGAVQSVPGELLSSAANWGYGGVRTAFEGSEMRKAMGVFGDKLLQKYPFLGRLTEDTDFANNFLRGHAVQKGLRNMQGVNREIGQSLPAGTTFAVRVPDPNNPGRFMTVHENLNDANEVLTDLNDLGFSQKHGQPKEGVNAKFARTLKNQNKDAIAYKLNWLSRQRRFPRGPGNVEWGNQWVKSRNDLDAMHTLSEAFTSANNKGPLFHPEHSALMQEPLMRELDNRSEDLQRSMTLKEYNDLQRSLVHGAKGERRDILSRKGEAALHAHLGVSGLTPSVNVRPPRWYQPVPGPDLSWYLQGQKVGTPVKKFTEQAAGHYLFDPVVPGYVPGSSRDASGAPLPPPTEDKPPGPGASAAGSFRIPSFEGTAFAEEPPPDTNMPKAVTEIRDLQNRDIAPTPGGGDAVGKIADRLKPGGKPQNVSTDLERGRISSDGLKKLLQRGSTTDAAANIAGVPLHDLLSATEAGTDAEKQHLVPLIQQRMQRELPQIANKTLQANLSQRFARLQRDVAPPAPLPAPLSAAYPAQPRTATPLLAPQGLTQP